MAHLTLGFLTVSSPALETVSAAAEGGFKSVSIRIAGFLPSDPFPQVIGNPNMIRDIRNRARDGGVRISNTTPNALFPGVTLADLKPALETTAELGVKIIVANCYTPDDDRFLELLVPYCELARQYDIRVAVEFVPHSEVKSIDQATALIAKSRQPNAGLVIDALHLYRSGGSAQSIKAVNPEQILLFHICDGLRRDGVMSSDELKLEARTARLPPGDGQIPIYEFLDALPRDVEIEYEVPRPEQQSLTPTARAKIASTAAFAYLKAYCDARGEAMRWA